MPTSIHDILDELYVSSTDERDKGDKFERLMVAYLRTDVTWSDRFSNVWLWGEWPGRHGKPDTGIDLVAEERETGGLTAIQPSARKTSSTTFTRCFTRRTIELSSPLT